MISGGKITGFGTDGALEGVGRMGSRMADERLLPSSRVGLDILMT